MLIKGTKASEKKWASRNWSPCFFPPGRGQAYLLQVQRIYKFYPLTNAVYPEPSLASGSQPLSKSSLTRLTLPSNAACQIPLSKSISVNDCAQDKGFDEQPQAFSCSQEWSISAVIKWQHKFVHHSARTGLKCQSTLYTCSILNRPLWERQQLPSHWGWKFANMQKAFEFKAKDWPHDKLFLGLTKAPFFSLYMWTFHLC